MAEAVMGESRKGEGGGEERRGRGEGRKGREEEGKEGKGRM